MHSLPLSAYKERIRQKLKNQTRRSASAPAWPPPAGSPAPVPRWRGCSGACCPCPSRREKAFPGIPGMGKWVAAQVLGYTAGATWWGSPVGSEDEEKPLHTREGEPGRRKISIKATSLHFYPRK